MRRLRRLWKVRPTGLPGREQELDEEIESHLRLAAADRIAGGESPEQAAASARREFGNATLIRETAREVWNRAWLESLVRDLRYALRSFGRTPASTAIIILTLALGIGASAAIFSIVDAVLLRPLPYRDSTRLVAVWDQAIDARETSKLFAQYQDFLDLERTATSFQQMAGVTWAAASAILTGYGPAKSVLAIPATAGFFSLLGVAPAHGRTFAPSDTKRGCTVVLAHAFWQTVLGGRNDIVGRTLALDDRPCTVIGVMPSGFQFYPEQTSLWTLVTNSDEIARNAGRRGIGIFARLKPGISIAAAQTEVRRLHRQFNEHNRHGQETEPAVYPLQDEFTWMAGRNLRLTLLMLFAAVNFVLPIVCVNVANLLLGRIIGRQREFSIRAALGSGRPRLVRQLLTESLLLSAGAALLGCALAVSAVRLFRAWAPVELPPGAAASVNLPVLGFMGLALRRGRNFEPFDTMDSDLVAIVNEAVAERYFADEDPIGRRIRVTDDPPPNPWLRIVGVVANEKRSTVYNEMAWVDTPTVYRPLAQRPASSVNLLIRGAALTGTNAPDRIRQQIASIDPGVAAGSPETLQHQLSGYLAYPRFRAALLAAFALLALLLALIGIYGVLSQQVPRRTSEIGIRMALGAARADVLKMVAKQGVALSIAGIAIGLGSVRALTRLLEALLYGVSPTDPLTLGLVTLLLLAAAALAAILPAMRASRVDPLVAVRYE